jgi:type IV secretory pathway VirB10-like protein
MNFGKLKKTILLTGPSPKARPISPQSAWPSCESARPIRAKVQVCPCRTRPAPPQPLPGVRATPRHQRPYKAEAELPRLALPRTQPRSATTRRSSPSRRHQTSPIRSFCRPSEEAAVSWSSATSSRIQSTASRRLVSLEHHVTGTEQQDVVHCRPRNPSTSLRLRFR